MALLMVFYLSWIGFVATCVGLAYGAQVMSGELAVGILATAGIVLFPLTVWLRWRKERIAARVEADLEAAGRADEARRKSLTMVKCIGCGREFPESGCDEVMGTGWLCHECLQTSLALAKKKGSR